MSPAPTSSLSMAETLADYPLADYKRLIACADGTWLSSDIGAHAVPSNVAKIARACSTEGLDNNGKLVQQVVQYQSGLGAADLPFQKAIAGGMGIGLDTDICMMYDFLANNYRPGDEIFFFGFSRGAYTVRSVAGLVCDVGILPAVEMSHFPDLWDAYQRNRNGRPFQDSTWYRNHQEKLKLHPVKIKVVGVWETVGSLGIPEWPVVKSLAKLGIDLNKINAFHNTKLSNHVEYAFQALGLDEKRLTFPPTMWNSTGDNGPTHGLEQCWFPGVHSNVGGQQETYSLLGDHEEIGDNTLAWMIDNVSGMLTFTNSAIDAVVQHHCFAINRTRIQNGWGCGWIVDNFFGLLGLVFRLLGQETRTPGGYGTGTNESIHPTARIRRNKVRDWHPPCLKDFEVLDANGIDGGWRWQKSGTTTLREWVMHSDKTMSVRYGENGSTSFGQRESLSRELCPKDILWQLDLADHSHGGGKVDGGRADGGKTNGVTKN